MTEIQIYTATADNAGKRRESGALLKVGDDKTCITLDRAEKMVEAGTAVEVNGKKASAKKSKA